MTIENLVLNSKGSRCESVDNDEGIKSFSLTATHLKMIAIILMFFDHFAATVLTHFQGQSGVGETQFVVYQTLIVTIRTVGRLSFPIFAYLIVNGFYHTSNKRNYFLRLVGFAFISELFFDFGIFGTWVYMGHQNVFFTLALGLLGIWGYDALKDKGTFKKILGTVFVLAVGFLSSVIRSDYDIYGVMTIFFMYLFFKNFKRMSIAIIAFNLAIYWSGFLSWFIIPAWFEGAYGWELKGVQGSILHVLTYIMINAQCLSVCALPVIKCYKGEKGKPFNKYIFYAFYPVHLFLFGLIMQLLK
ncbi:MAG: TraX family protein [Turicibacter sp.]